MGVKVLGNIEVGEGVCIGVNFVVLSVVLVYIMVVGVLVKVVGKLSCFCLVESMN